MASTSSSSSSSEMFCRHPDCYDSFCSHFSLWDLTGVLKLYLDNNKLYVSFSSDGINQTVEIYDSSDMYHIVAYGISATSIINIVEENGSGISGSVIWDGYPVGFLTPEKSILYCISQSTSSSSSDSSNSSSSHSSMSSNSGTSSSSSTYYKSSSSSSKSSSSSTYVKSSSSSSSSSTYAKTSSSSSSDFADFYQLKPLFLANSSIVNKKIAQTLVLENINYSIGNVYCYLYSSELSHNYNIHLSIFATDSEGKPLTELYTSSINGLSVIENEWYQFSFNIELTTPTNGMISFVMWQDGGDDNNCVMWGYNTSNDNFSWTSNDGTNWTNQPLITRSIKIAKAFDLFDLVNYTISTPPAENTTLLPILNSNTASYTNTIYDANTNSVQILHPDLLLSFVVDSSGSMGWNDRLNNRSTFVANTISRFKDFYPANVAFDIIKFGSFISQTGSPISPNVTTLPINLDLNNPTRTTYVFNAIGSITNVSEGTIYINNGIEFTVQTSVSGNIKLTCLGISDPLISGTLERLSGFGDNEIVYGSYTKASINNLIIAYGFKNLENGHTYHLAKAAIDNVDLSEISLVNFELLTNTGDTPSIAIGTNGPIDSPTSLDFIATTSLNLRRPLGNLQYTNTLLTSNIIAGSNVCSVLNVLNLVNTDMIDLVSNKNVSLYQTITNVNGNTITFDPPSVNTITTFGNGLVQTTSYFKGLNITGTTLQLLFMDTAVSNSIIFYLQDLNGNNIEWDIRASSQWYSYNIYWLDETATLNVSLFDMSGQPYPNGTAIYLDVNTKSIAPLSTDVTSQSVTKSANIGDTIVYLASNQGFIRDEKVILINGTNKQTVTVSEVGQNNTGYYIKTYEPLEFSFGQGTTAIPVVINTVPILGANTVALTTGLVDITPIYTQQSIDSSLLQPYDLPPLVPSTTYEEVTNATSSIRTNNINIPSINGFAVARVLPITEDILETLDQKANKAEQLLRLDPPPVLVGQNTQNTGDLSNANATTTTTTTLISGDWTIQSPVYLYNGHAKSSMQSFADSSNLSNHFFTGLISPGFNSSDPSVTGTDLKVAEYTIYPSIRVLSETDVILAAQYFNSFEIFFTPRYQITCIPDNKFVKFYVPNFPAPDNAEISGTPPPSWYQGYTETYKAGIYAGEDSYTLNYIVTDRLILLKNGTLKINVYSNKQLQLDNLEDIAKQGVETQDYTLNPILPTTQAPTDIDQWRTIVEQNPSDFSYSANTDLNQPVEVTNPSHSSLFYSNATSWTYATQYPTYSATVNIVNGRASFTLPSSLDLATIFVEAIFAPSNIEYIAENIVFVVSPIEISGPLQYKLTADSTSTFELGFNVNYSTNSTSSLIIDDGLPVQFLSTTSAYPSVSVTNNGDIGGVFLGPKPVWTLTQDTESLEWGPNPILEVIRLTMQDPNGNTISVKRLIAWEMSQPIETSNASASFYIQGIPEASNCWADGTSITEIFVSDINDSTNLDWLGSDGVSRLKGFDQPSNLASVVTAFFGQPQDPCIVSTPIVGLYPKLLPTSTRWDENGKVTFTTSPYNYNLGDDEIFNFVAKTNYLDSNAISVPVTGYFTQPSNDNPSCSCYPSIIAKEPLGIKITNEFEGPIFIRDGIQQCPIVVTVTWKGQNLWKSNPTIMPRIAFVAGTDGQSNYTPPDDNGNTQRHDARFNQYLSIVSSPDISLDNYSMDASFSRTDIEPTSNHTHECTVDNNGNGATTNTIRIGNSIEPDHQHEIANYITNTISYHSHEVRCIGVTNILPMTNTVVQIRVIGYALYDPTLCAPNTRGTGSYVPDYLFPSNSKQVTTYTYYQAKQISQWGPPAPDNYFANYVGPAQSFYGNQTSSNTFLNNPIYLQATANVGTTKIYVVDNSGFSVGMQVFISDSASNSLKNVISTTGADANGKYLILTIPLNVNYTLANNSQVVPLLSVGNSLTQSANVVYTPVTILNTTYLLNRVMADDLSILGYDEGNSAFSIYVLSAPHVSKSSEQYKIYGANVTASNNDTIFQEGIFTANTPYDTNAGFDIAVQASWDSYQYMNTTTWEITTVPERPVADGCRITLEISGTQPPVVQNNGSTVFVVDPSVVKAYVYLKCNLTFTDIVDNVTVQSVFYFKVSSILQWIPGTFSLTDRFTKDEISITNALSQINWLGASQLYDGIYLAANRLIQAQSDSNVYSNYLKTILVVTDGDENNSQKSLEQAINNVNLINGNKIVQLDPVLLGLSTITDETILLKCSLETGGNNVVKMNNLSNSNILNLMNQMIINPNNSYNKGFYLNTSSLLQSIPTSVSIGDTSIGPNQIMLYDVNLNQNGNIRSITQGQNVSIPSIYQESIDNLTSNIGINVSLYGDEYFGSPVLLQAPLINYLNPEITIVNFNPISLSITNNQYLSSILITHEADIPNTSILQYGISQVLSNDPNDYNIDGKYINADTHQIMLTRYNEPLITLNNKKYIALNGRWSSICKVEIYRLNNTISNGQLVNSSLYALNSTIGSVTFTTVQPNTDRFLICIYFQPLFRIIQKTINYGSTPAIIHYVGTIYNVMKRIPTDINGNIINNDIGSTL